MVSVTLHLLGVVVGDTFHGQHFRSYIFYLLFLVEITNIRPRS